MSKWGWRNERQVLAMLLVAAARRKLKIPRGAKTPQRVRRNADETAAEWEARERDGGRKAFRRKRRLRRRRRAIARESRRRNRGRA